MSEFNVEVYTLNRLETHNNADSLEVAYYYDYPVVIRKGQFKQGDKVVYIPIDALVPVNEYPFQFLKTTNDQVIHRVKAKKLRGVYSQGLFVESEPTWQPGQNVQKELHITKWEPVEQFNSIVKGQMSESSPPGCIVPVYDLEGWRRFSNVILPGENVVITEKIEGMNFRCLHTNDTFYVGSHRKFWKCDEANLWWKIAKLYNLEELCKQHQNLVMYAEIYGPNVIKGFNYGATSQQLAFFDIFNTFTDCWLHYDLQCKIFETCGFPMVPTLYKGPFTIECLELRNSVSAQAFGNGAKEHMAEGIVIESLDRTTFTQGKHINNRAKLKFVSENYLLGKNV